jgi:tetratricopeptide (TPR) repeat protein
MIYMYAPNEDESIKSRFEGNTTLLSPASIAGPYIPPVVKVAVPLAMHSVSTVDAEVAQRERGNEEYRAGNFAAAAKSYTRCLGMKQGNLLAFSNRASAYLKLKEFSKAEGDCTSALNLNKSHVKSLVRRASARNSLGKHRGALEDLLAAQSLDPATSNRRVELNKTRELLRAAVNRATFISVPVMWKEGDEEPRPGPDMPVR